MGPRLAALELEAPERIISATAIALVIASGPPLSTADANATSGDSSTPRASAIARAYAASASSAVTASNSSRETVANWHSAS
jgi:hypothetical protein